MEKSEFIDFQKEGDNYQVSVKFEEEFAKDIEKIMKKHRYMTKAEFIREKIKELEKEEALARLKKIYGASKRKTTDEELHKVREEVFEELEREIK